MHLASLRGFSVLLGVSSILLATGCSEFVAAGCETDGCESTGGSTTEAGTTAPGTTGTTDDGTTGGTTAVTTMSSTDTTGGPSTGTGPGTETGGGTETGTETGIGTETGGEDPVCGDGVVDAGETCDDGDDNSDVTPDACRTTCEPAGCGDSVIDAGETCDDGVNNNDVTPDACRTTCELAACGDSVIDAGETCDDENGVETDGCLSTCVIPTSCAVILAEVPTAGDDTYDIAPDGVLLTTACDMTTEGGGWTLVGKVNNADTDGVSEPVGWFGTESNAASLASPDLTLNASPESHGSGRFSPIITEGTSLTRFELIEGGSVTESVDWFKIVGTTASFEAWFSETDPDISTVCTDVAMTANCSSGLIQSQGTLANNVTVLSGMRITHYFPDGDPFPIHIRQDNNNPSGDSGMISGTIGVPAWTPGYDGHVGNGLRIWLRE